MKTTIEGTEIFDTVRGAKTAAARRGYGEGAKIMECSKGYILLASTEGFAGSTTGWNLMKSATPLLWLAPSGDWLESN